MDISGTTITKSPEETAKLGEELGDLLRKKVNGKRKKGSGQDRRKATVVCLYGELGSGKTTFVQGFGKAMGISSRLPSPTFFIVRRYSKAAGSGFFYHIDLYRVMDEKELVELGFPELFADPDSIVLIEWAEKLGRLLPKRRIDVQFSVLSDESHQIAINK